MTVREAIESLRKNLNDPMAKFYVTKETLEALKLRLVMYEVVVALHPEILDEEENTIEPNKEGKKEGK